MSLRQKKHKILKYWSRIFSILFSKGDKVYLLCQPEHPNLGDQAQLMCTDMLLKRLHPGKTIIHVGNFGSPINLGSIKKQLITCLSSLITLSVIKLKLNKNDIFYGHSGYFFVDHHSGYKSFLEVIGKFPNNRVIILPQTVNFYTPVVKQLVSKKMANAKNVTLLCRDEVSYENAKSLFPNNKKFLYPDIVTSLIGTRHYANKRDGILFCMRDDIEAFYKPEDINGLMDRFIGIHKEKTDTTLHGVSAEELEKARDEYIYGMIDKFASFKLVITDRYHGTIFSAIASTPVVVISSSDHKLSSGVKWFPKKEFEGMIHYAQNLDEAYNIATEILKDKHIGKENPPYFKEQYWDKFEENIINS